MIKYEVVFLGSTSVGKTCLFEKMIGGSTSNILPTTQCSNYIINYKYNDNIIPIRLWDTAGQEKYRSLTTAYLRNANGIFMVYDLTNKISYEDLINFSIQLDNVSIDVPILLIGNKQDLIWAEKCQFNSNIKAFMEKIKAFDSIETSALLNKNVEEALDLMVSKLEEVNKQSILPTTAHIDSEGKHESCC